MVAYHHPGIGLVDKTSRFPRECSVFSAVCLGPWQNYCEFLLVMRPTYRSILNEKERASERQLCWSMASCWKRLSRSSSCRPAVCFNDCAMGPYVGLSSFSLSNVLGKLWIIGICYRGMFVSVGQSHDISLWSILSLGNRSINVEMIYKLRVFDINWYLITLNWYLITLIIYVQTLKWLLGELTRGYDTPV